MCGIAGIVSHHHQPIDAEELHAMCAAMVRRGPDDEGIYLGDGAGLAMRRLSIIDIQTGHQPVCNEDASIWVVLNGEIYNYRELRSQLEQAGHTFRTSTDTEVIVHLYEDRGEACVDALRGMFGFALWDERRRRLLLARDRLGIKPLYFGTVGGRFLFASELKAILQISDVERELNWSSLSHLLTYGTTPPEESIIEGIHKLEPGHRVLLEQGKEPLIERYWDIRFTPNTRRSEEDTIEELQTRLQEAVRYHQVSDVPVGAFLSGGIDSSSVVAMMARTATTQIKTFSIGWHEQDYNELPYARLIAQQFGTDHHELVLEPDVLDLMDHLAWDLDEPFGDASAIPTYMVSKLAAQHVKVVLSGDGGDELFGGYDKYVVESRERMTRFLPPFMRSLLAQASRRWPNGVRGKNSLRHFSLPGPERYLDASTLFKEEDQAPLLTPAVRQHLDSLSPAGSRLERLAHSTDHWLSTIQDLDLRHYLPLDILTKVDRMSMAHSLESRVPLLDHPLVEFAATIPADWKLRGSRTKYIFVRALRGLVPDAILDRPKKGFGVPLGRWFRGALRPMVRELLLADTSRRRGLFNATRVEQLLDQHDQGQPLDQQLWMLMSFELWCRTFLDRRSGLELPTPPPRAVISSIPPVGRRLSGAKGVAFGAALPQRRAS
jgi:asparagine synthase (glutamine-hydrolysing)